MSTSDRTPRRADATPGVSPVDSGDSDGLGAFLVSLQLTDSAFPSGRYTRSDGVEALVRSGYLDSTRPIDALGSLLAEHLRHAVGPTDGAALARAHRACTDAAGTDRGDRLPEPVARVDERLTAVKLAREAREASLRTGRALLSTAGAVFGDPRLVCYAEQVRAGRLPGNAAVVQGVLTASLGVPRAQALAGELHAFCAGWSQAAVRLAVLDHRGAQRLLSRLRPVLVEVTSANVDKELSRIGGSTPLVDGLSMQHERAQLRLFAT